MAVWRINGMPHATADSYACSTDTVLDSLISPDPREARLPAAAYAAAGAVTHSYGDVMRVPGAALERAARETRDSHVLSAVICAATEGLARAFPGLKLAEGRFAHRGTGGDWKGNALPVAAAAHEGPAVVPPLNAASSVHTDELSGVRLGLICVSCQGGSSMFRVRGNWCLSLL